MNEQEEKELILRAMKGDEAGLRDLFAAYAKPIYNFIYRHVLNEKDAEDISQDVFVSAWKNLRKFDPEKSFRPWLFTIARNAALNWIKKKKPALFSEFENEAGENALEENLESEIPLPDEIFARKDAAKAVNEALSRLKKEHRLVLLLRYEEDMTFEEIGKVLGEPMNTVKTRHFRGLLKLKEELLKSEPKPEE